MRRVIVLALRARLFAIEHVIAALQWVRCRMAGWIGSAYTYRDQLSAELIWMNPP